MSIHLKKKKKKRKRVSYNVSKQLRWHSAKHPLSIERNPRNKAGERWIEIRVEREKEREREVVKNGRKRAEASTAR